MRFRQIWSKSHKNLREILPESGFFGRDLSSFFFFFRILEFYSPGFGFLVGVWVLFQNLGFSPVGLGFSGFRGIETETDWFRSGPPGGSGLEWAWTCLLTLHKYLYL